MPSWNYIGPYTIQTRSDGEGCPWRRQSFTKSAFAREATAFTGGRKTQNAEDHILWCYVPEVLMVVQKKPMNRRKKKLICCYLFLWHLFQQQLPSIQSDLVLRPDSRFQRNFHSNAKHSKNRKSAFVYSIYSLNCSCAQITENIQGRRKQWDCSWSVGWRCHR